VALEAPKMVIAVLTDAVVLSLGVILALWLRLLAGWTALIEVLYDFWRRCSNFEFLVI
jgi:hypothetical protein